MGIDKDIIKVGAWKEVGVHIEQQLDAAEALVHQEDGAAKALTEQTRNLMAIAQAAEKTLDEPEGREDRIEDLDQLKMVKRWLAKAIAATDNAAAGARNRAMLARGAANQLKGQHDWLQKLVQQTNEMVEARKRARELFAHASEAGELEAGVMLDDDGDPVWCGDGAPPRGIRPGNRAERQAYAELMEAKKAPVKKSPAKKKVTRTRSPRKRGGNGHT